MRKRIVSLLEERIDEKIAQINQLYRDKATYKSNIGYGSYETVAKDAVARAKKTMKRLKKETVRLMEIKAWIERF